MTLKEIKVDLVDYTCNQDTKDMMDLLACYALDIMGGGDPLSEYTKVNLASELAKLPHAFSFICYVDKKPAGLINCFDAFSTFKCKPIINIHDVIVLPEYRGLGLSQIMLKKVEEVAEHKGCCKLTLEVLEANQPAQAAYTKFGFSGYELNPKIGQALFWEKTL
ncbi:GNAT family N-acetyltransferase [Neptuniibacter marinus]|uniref:GNAT family N-acetyltransferase n=1 Tax=Neptuniibacter marinus TaxID=1806670 RepID=UPI000AB358C4|nr:GNAT family N-acetyltransferase [Neptuniibacter marinus]